MSADTSSEEWRHECEVRHVINLPTNDRRREYLDGIAKARGEAAAKRLREDAWAAMRARRAA